MLLYRQEDIDTIRTNLKAGKLKFKLTVGDTDYSCYFGKQGKRILQRIDNFMLGLTYVPEDDAFIFNYPHLSNIRENQIPEIKKDIGCYYRQLWATEKLNGTNLGLVIPITSTGQMNTIIDRCRGSIEPESFMNEINKRILTGQTNYVGIKPEVFASFIDKYTPILKEGQNKGLVDDFGSFKLAKIAPILKEQVKEALNSGGKYTSGSAKLIGIFGELTSKYNPIAVDGDLKFGMYLDSPNDYEWTVFDVMYEDSEGNIYLDCDVGFLEEYGLRTVKMLPLKDIGTCLDEFTEEEGILIKGWKDTYIKMKHADVIEWARTMGKLPTIMDSAISHIFEQGLGFSKVDVLENFVLKEQETIEGIVKSVWEEIEDKGVKRVDLEEYYTAKKRESKDIDFDLMDKLNVNLMMLTASILKDAGIVKEILYMELPKYIVFNREAIFFDDKKKKWRANAWYGKMLGTTIGRCYLERKVY